MVRKKIFVVISIFFIFLCITGIFIWKMTRRPTQSITPLGIVTEKPLDKYTIERLSKRKFTASKIVFNEAIATTSAYTTYIFHFKVYDSDGETGKNVTGVAHVPSGKPGETFPVIVQFRGFVDPKIYAAGIGTKPSAEVFASNGFLTLAPDFLGYGGSDKPSENVFEERFETYTTALTLLASVLTLPQADTDHIFIWGHSNGGQIALTIATILGDKGYPTTLWAPVTKPFPYNILYYTDEFDDQGMALRKELAKFENNYDVNYYSLTNYLDNIAVPVQFHQGTADEAVPAKWSDSFVSVLQQKRKDIRYFIYPGADHNMKPAWDTVINRDIKFFQSFLP